LGEVLCLACSGCETGVQVYVIKSNTWLNEPKHVVKNDIYGVSIFLIVVTEQNKGINTGILPQPYPFIAIPIY
jgi:hypothetical protein